ncbi:MAG: GNAT family N-acetyltransferase [Brevundimonas sp.]|uniref:GNAT family N-acetyltransferase n=1 Tax=Brevundimonas sp. TaxID=1871086 RepID=UPI0039196D9F
MIRPLTLADLPAALALQAGNYPPALHDGPEAFASRIRVAPQWCWAVEREGELLAYLLSHPWMRLSPPAPDTVLERAQGDCWYIHDLSVAPEARGLGLARQLIEHGAAAQTLKRSELIAVEGARDFWLRHGWSDARALPPALHDKVMAYGASAAYMVRDLA